MRFLLPEARVWAWRPVLFGCAFISFAIAALASVPSAANEPDARLFATHALAFREAGIAAEPDAFGNLAEVPGAAGVSEEEAPALWVPFFENAIVALGRLRSDLPVALYYNPLLDVGLLTFWQRSEDGYGMASLRAFPGDGSRDEGAPSWTGSPASPFEALARQTASRLEAFRRTHPPDADDPGQDSATFAAAAKAGRAVLKRLYLNAVRRARWIDGSHPWLEPALVRLEAVLAAADSATALKAAPQTDTETADALARLPEGFASGLTLDMALAAGEDGRLLIASRPEDGDIYLLALCQMVDAEEKASACALRRIVLLSLLE